MQLATIKARKVVKVSIVGGAERLISDEQLVRVDLVKWAADPERDAPVRVLISAIDGTAHLGRDFEGLEFDPTSNTSVSAEPVDARTIALRFPRGEQHCAVRLKMDDGTVYQPTLAFTVRLIGAEIASTSDDTTLSLAIYARVPNAFLPGFANYTPSTTSHTRQKAFTQELRLQNAVPNAPSLNWLSECASPHMTSGFRSPGLKSTPIASCTLASRWNARTSPPSRAPTQSTGESTAGSCACSHSATKRCVSWSKRASALLRPVWLPNFDHCMCSYSS